MKERRKAAPRLRVEMAESVRNRGRSGDVVLSRRGVLTRGIDTRREI
jgi:hypothetical protein